MSGAELATMLTALAAVGGVLGTWWTQRHKPKVDRAAAVDAEQKTISEIRTADIDGLRDIIASLREEVTDLRGRVERAERRATDAEAAAATAERARTEAETRWSQEAAYVQVLLDHWPTPPPPPRPPT